jgi:hypothetical protein
VWAARPPGVARQGDQLPERTLELAEERSQLG